MCRARLYMKPLFGQDSICYLVGGKSVINWVSYDWIQPCRFSLCPVFFIPTYVPHQIIHLESSIASRSRISTSNCWGQNLYFKPLRAEERSPLLCSPHFLSHLPKWFDIASLPSNVLISSSQRRNTSTHKLSQPGNVTLDDTSLFSDDVIRTLPVAEYQFLAPLPKANYATKVLTTAGQ